MYTPKNPINQFPIESHKPMQFVSLTQLQYLSWCDFYLCTQVLEHLECCVHTFTDIFGLRMEFFEQILLYGNAEVCRYKYVVTTKYFYYMETRWLQLRLLLYITQKL